MDADKGPPDDLDVRLDWPEGAGAMADDDIDLGPSMRAATGRETAKEDRQTRSEPLAAEAAGKSDQRRASKRAAQGVDKQSLERLEHTVAGLADDQARLIAASLERVESAVAALRDERDWQAAVFAQLEEVVTALAEAEKRNQASLTRLARLEDRLDRVVAALSDSQRLESQRVESQKAESQAVAPAQLPDRQLLAELDIRFDELLAALADQFDPPPGGSDPRVLEEIQARLDEVVGLLAELPPPTAFEEDVVTELRTAVKAMEGMSLGVADHPASAEEHEAIIERLDQLAEQVDGLRRRIAVRAKPGAGPGGLDDAILAAIASAVTTQMNERPARPRKAAAPREPRPSRSGPT
jgi:hypothetical protein